MIEIEEEVSTWGELLEKLKRLTDDQLKDPIKIGIPDAMGHFYPQTRYMFLKEQITKSSERTVETCLIAPRLNLQ